MLIPELINEMVCSDLMDQIEKTEDPKRLKLIVREIGTWSVEKAIEKYLNSQGLSGYSKTVISAIDNIRAAYRPDVEPPVGTIVSVNGKAHQRCQDHWHPVGSEVAVQWFEIKDDAEILK